LENNSDIRHRKSLRLQGYDYAQTGLYFVTVCTENRRCLFGEIIVGAGSKPAQMVVNENGEIVKNTWFDLVNHVDDIVLHEFVVMPNHVHGIIEIDRHRNGTVVDRAGLEPAPTRENGFERAGLEPAPTRGNEFVGAGSKPALAGQNGFVGAGSKPAPTRGNEFVGAGSKPASTEKRQPLSEIVRQFKTFSAKRINQLRNSSGAKVWQRNYYEHVIRSEESYLKIAEYVRHNAATWLTDKYYSS